MSQMGTTYLTETIKAGLLPFTIDHTHELVRILSSWSIVSFVSALGGAFGATILIAATVVARLEGRVPGVQLRPSRVSSIIGRGHPGLSFQSILCSCSDISGDAARPSVGWLKTSVTFSAPTVAQNGTRMPKMRMGLKVIISIDIEVKFSFISFVLRAQQLLTKLT